jgi:hypothetical protein
LHSKEKKPLKNAGKSKKRKREQNAVQSSKKQKLTEETIPNVQPNKSAFKVENEFQVKEELRSPSPIRSPKRKRNRRKKKKKESFEEIPKVQLMKTEFKVEEEFQVKEEVCSPRRSLSPPIQGLYFPPRNSPDHNRIYSPDKTKFSQPSDMSNLQIEKQETKFQLDVKRIFHYFHEYIEIELNKLIPALVHDLWGENSSQERTNKKRDEIWEYIFNKHIEEDVYFKNLEFKESFKTGMEKLYRQKWENKFCETK